MAGPFRTQLSQEVIRSSPGGPPAQVLLTVQNLGTGIEDYQVEVELVAERPAWPLWITLAPAKLIGLYPVGTPDQPSEGQVTVIIQPPADLTWAAGRYPLRLRVFPKGEPEQTRDVELRLDVPAAYDLALHLDPEEQSGLLEDGFWLEVKNQGNAVLALGFRASDEEKGCIFEFEPVELHVPVGGTATTELKVRACAPLTPPEDRLHPFTIEAYLAQDPSRAWQTSGMWIQVAPSLQLTINPEVRREAEQGVFAVEVSNEGKSHLTVQLEAADAGNEGAYLFELSRLVLRPGERLQSYLKVQRRVPLPDQERRPLSFMVTARLAEVPGVTVEARGQWDPVGKPKKPDRGWRLWLTWTLANGAAGIVPGVALGLVPTSLDGPAGAALWAAFAGACLGTAQWLILRRRISLSAWWILASAGGLTLATGILQWLILRRQVARAGWWVVANILAVPVALFAGTLANIVALIVSDRPLFVSASETVYVLDIFGPGAIVLSLVAGVVLGVITGIALVLLLRQTPPKTTRT
jgi:hypothetical protein